MSAASWNGIEPDAHIRRASRKHASVTVPAAAARGVVDFARRGAFGPPRAEQAQGRTTSTPPTTTTAAPLLAWPPLAPDSNGREARGTSLQIKRLLLSLAKCAAEAGVRGSKPLGATRAALTVPRAAPVARRARLKGAGTPRPLKARQRCAPRVP